ncbi:MAG: glycosyltransferase involved in cell wall biosynthesis [Planctomycetota bacterium]
MKNKDTYLVVTPFFPSNEYFVGSYVFDQVNELRNQTNFNIEIVKAISIFSSEQDYKFKGFSVHVFKTIDFPYFIFPGVFNQINKKRFFKLLKKNKIENIKYSHSHVSYPSAYLVEDLVCKKIVQHHGLDVLQLTNGRNKFMRNIQKRFLIRNTIKHLNNADINLGVSNLVLQQLRNYRTYNPQNEFVLYNGVDTSKFFVKETAKNDVFTIGCVANFWKIKDHITLIKSIQRILEDGNKIKLRLIGSGHTLKYCKKFVFENNLSKYIIFEKEIAHEKLNDFYNSIDLFVLPSYYEALGCVYLESWATNTPFVGIEGQGISELISNKEKKNILAEEQSAEPLKEKILIAYNNRRSYPFDEKYDIKNTIYDFLSLDIFEKND